jgi:cephalosporin-C deacetylase
MAPGLKTSDSGRCLNVLARKIVLRIIRAMRFKRACFPVFLITLACAGLCRAEQMAVAPDQTNGVYQPGDTVRWRVEWKGETNPPPARYRLLKGDLTEIGQGDLNFSNRHAELETRFDAPGSLLLKVKWTPEDGKEQRSIGGAVAAPNQITLSAPRPADFDEFWNAKLEALKKVPANPKLESVDIGMTNVAYEKITLDNIRGTHIYGQLARPAQGRKFPALLIVQWAGVYPLQKAWVTDRAADGWLALNIEPHDLPIDQPEAFYKEQFNGPLKDYWSIGNDDRESSYYLRMFLSCYRAVEYLTQRKDWDGKTLVVMGGSQGGMQALMTAGLHPQQITAVLASVPAGCDMLGPDIGRKGGWPQWYSNTNGKDSRKVRQTSRYFDVANFAPRIRCPVLVGLGLVDEVCPPAGILAAVNQISSPKEVIILPQAGHQDEHNTHGAYVQRCYSAWLPALREGKPAPVNR